jgi:uncharacterized protein (DUF983 family)
MTVQLFGQKAAGFPQNLARRGYHVAYREGEANRCPGCGRSHWYVGRLSAECGFCGTALPLTDSLGAGAGLFRTTGRPYPDFASAA